MRQFGGFDGFNQRSVELFGVAAAGNMLDDADFAGQLLAVPVLVAVLLILQLQFSALSDLDTGQAGVQL